MTTLGRNVAVIFDHELLDGWWPTDELAFRTMLRQRGVDPSKPVEVRYSWQDQATYFTQIDQLEFMNKETR